jgi:hypothetical protein
MTPLVATRALIAPAPSTSLRIASTRALPRLRSLLRSSDASDSPATTQTTRYRPYALYDIPVPHPPSCSLRPHPGVADSVLAHALDTALSRIGRNSYLRLHAQCVLPPHSFFAPPFSLSPPSPFTAPRPVRRARLRSLTHLAHHTAAPPLSSCSLGRHIDICTARLPYFLHVPHHPPPSLVPLDHLRRPYSRTRP